MYLVVIAWVYVALMMAVAEATASTGTLLGAIMTFVLYGLLPVALVVYLLGTPRRRRALRRQALAERRAASAQLPDAGRHAAGAAEPGGIAPVREEP
ncbi:hypothetical protein GT347_04125 [Xylophilus rhododendri]|uniref:Transmembrane protein n=1 Tax=Xylophilus rhododendri TaxID=2697032 RepID=A0A857J2Z5_9BURK|nr:hypothetical protein [Xylophilus rhododendri]QHI97235.1 hypothetical protein GT347_04125 [Xylophilus rhododendri]